MTSTTVDAAPRRGSRALAVLQRIGRSLMLPIAVRLLTSVPKPSSSNVSIDAFCTAGGSNLSNPSPEALRTREGIYSHHA